MITPLKTVLFDGVTYAETLNIEVVRPTMRADRVYKIFYRDEPHILHIEFQISGDADLPARLHVYWSVLYQDYRLPIITVVVYPFRTMLAKSPLCVTSGEQELLRFNYRILPLFEQDGTTYVRTHALSMYPLLPTMQHVDHTLIKQALDEMVNFYRDQEVVLAQQFTWMNIFLERTDTIASEEKQKIREVMKMLDRLWEESPRVQETFAKGKAEGRAEGQVEGLRLSVATITAARFPALAELARRKAASIDQPDALKLLLEQISTVPNEEMARFLLQPSLA